MLRITGKMVGPIVLPVIATALLAPANISFALELKPKEIRTKTEEKPVSVLQRRYFKKRLRPELGLLAGQLLNEAYTDTAKTGVRVGLFATEWLGFEFQYVDTSVSSSDDREALDRLEFKKKDPEPGEEDTIVSPQPEENRIYGMLDFGVILAPFYGKANLLDFLIIYTDLYFGLGGAQLDTDQGNKTAIALSVGQRFYVFQSLSFRVEFRNHSFTEKRAGKDASRNQQSWDIGLSWFFL